MRNKYLLYLPILLLTFILLLGVTQGQGRKIKVKASENAQTFTQQVSPKNGSSHAKGYSAYHSLKKDILRRYWEKTTALTNEMNDYYQDGRARILGDDYVSIEDSIRQNKEKRKALSSGFYETEEYTDLKERISALSGEDDSDALNAAFEELSALHGETRQELHALEKESKDLFQRSYSLLESKQEELFSFYEDGRNAFSDRYGEIISDFKSEMSLLNTTFDKKDRFFNPDNNSPMPFRGIMEYCGEKCRRDNPVQTEEGRAQINLLKGFDARHDDIRDIQKGQKEIINFRPNPNR